MLPYAWGINMIQKRRMPSRITLNSSVCVCVCVLNAFSAQWKNYSRWIWFLFPGNHDSLSLTTKFMTVAYGDIASCSFNI